MRQKARKARMPREIGVSERDRNSGIFVDPFRAMIQYSRKCLNQFQLNQGIRLEYGRARGGADARGELHCEESHRAPFRPGESDRLCKPFQLLTATDDRASETGGVPHSAALW